MTTQQQASFIKAPWPTPEQPSYMYGAIKYPKATRRHGGDWLVMHTDGTIYNCHPQEQEGYWPIRFECERSLPREEYTQILNLFKDMYCFHDQDGTPVSVFAFDMEEALINVCAQYPQGTYTFDMVI